NAIALAPVEDFRRDSDLFDEGLRDPEFQRRAQAALKRGFQTRDVEIDLAGYLGGLADDGSKRKTCHVDRIRRQILLRCTKAGSGRYCCKSLFALPIKNSPGYRRDVRVKMWGTSSPDDKLVSDLAKATEAIKIAACRSDRLMAGKLSPRNFGLLQQYLPLPDL